MDAESQEEPAFSAVYGNSYTLVIIVSQFPVCVFLSEGNKVRNYLFAIGFKVRFFDSYPYFLCLSGLFKVGDDAK